MDVAVVGAGRVGTALAVLLARAGYRITAVAGRDATPARAARYLPDVPVLDLAGTARSAELVLVAVPDDAIARVVADLASAAAFREGAWVAHVSGARGLADLDPARGAGAHRLGLHPLQAVADVEGAIDGLPGCVFAVAADDAEGWALGETLARDLGGTPFRLDEERRAIYHAAAVFASNHVVATSAVATRLFRAAGVPDPAAAMRPLQRTTLENLERLGAGDALTGPAARGDAGTVARNLEALAADAPDAVAVYIAMARVALDVAVGAGRLDAAGRAAVDEVLDRWT